MNSPLIKVTRVRALPKYRLTLSFSDSTSGTADLSKHVLRAPFLDLRDTKMFAQAHLEHGAVTWPCDMDIATEALYALAHGLPRPTTGEQARANELEMGLRELRRLSGRTQAEIAEETGLTQGAISHLEHEVDHKISTLRKYAAANGARIEIVAVRGNKRIPLLGV
jgi:DNA-binding XRE family transcriptional regulator